MTPKEKLLQILLNRKPNPLYGIFFDGKLIFVTKARVYRQPGRAKSELVSQNLHYITSRSDFPTLPGQHYSVAEKARIKAAKDAVDELIKEGRLEIKQI